MITPALLTTKMVKALQQEVRRDTCGGRLLFTDCQAVLALYAQGNATAEDKRGIRAAQQRLCDHLNAEREAADARERRMLGCTVADLDEVLKDMTPRDAAMYAMGTLSNAQEFIQSCPDGDWRVRDEDANTIRQLINVAKYAMDKAVPR